MCIHVAGANLECEGEGTRAARKAVQPHLLHGLSLRDLENRFIRPLQPPPPPTFTPTIIRYPLIRVPYAISISRIQLSKEGLQSAKLTSYKYVCLSLKKIEKYLFTDHSTKGEATRNSDSDGIKTVGAVSVSRRGP